MKNQLFPFLNISPLRLTVLAIATMVGLWACAGTPPSDETKPVDTNQQAVATKSTPSSPTSSSKTQQTSSSSAAASQVRPAESADVHLIITAKTNLRVEPGSKGKIITRLKKGEKVIRLSISGSWCNVELSDHTTGWVLKKHTKEEK